MSEAWKTESASNCGLLTVLLFSSVQLPAICHLSIYLPLFRLSSISLHSSVLVKCLLSSAFPFLITNINNLLTPWWISGPTSRTRFLFLDCLIQLLSTTILIDFVCNIGHEFRYVSIRDVQTWLLRFSETERKSPKSGRKRECPKRKFPYSPN